MHARDNAQRSQHAAQPHARTHARTTHNARATRTADAATRTAQRAIRAIAQCNNTPHTTHIARTMQRKTQ
eukprot:1090965-Lingulodinium_polyedra.AAC.1